MVFGLRRLAVALLVQTGLCSKGDATYEKLIAAGIEASKTNMAGAVEVFRAATKAQPEVFDGHLNLGSALLAMQATVSSRARRAELLQQARVAVDTALHLQPSDKHGTAVKERVVAAVEAAVASQQAKVHTKPLISGRKAVVIDNAVPEEESARVINAYIAGNAGQDTTRWSRHYATDSSVWANAHGLAFDHKECMRKPMGTIIANAAKQYFPQCASQGALVVPYSCVINSQTFVDVDSVHRDFEHTDTFWGFTAIWYPHEVWNVHWAGATAFVDDAETDVLANTLPLPGRLVLFDSAMKHMSTPAAPISAPLHNIAMLPNERVLGNRFSFAYKYICSNLTVPEVYRRVDADGSGGVSLRELGQSFGSPQSPFPPLQLIAKDSKLLKKVDKNGDVSFSLPEFRKLVAKLGL